MALVSGQSFFPSAAELDTSPNSDDDYDYVSSLAEQIAHAMLDDDEPSEEEIHGFRLDPQTVLSERTSALLRIQRDAELAREHAVIARRSSSAKSLPSHQYSIEEIAAINEARHLLPFQETWEYYNSRPRYTSYPRSHHTTPPNVSAPLLDRNMNAFYARQTLQHGLWSGSCLNEERSTESWSRNNAEISHSHQSHRSLPRKESVGTGVFLPRVSNFSSHSRRKQDSSSKFSDKNKCRGGGS